MADVASVSVSGLWVPIVTPFAVDGSLDRGSLRRLAKRLVENGADGIVALGTTGEAATLTADERIDVVSICGEECRRVGRPLMVGAGTNATQTTIEEIARLANGAPIDLVLVVVPYYTRPTEQAVIEHFGLVAEASPVPVVMYNVPYRTGRGLGSAALLEASRLANVVGLKQAVGAVDLDTLEVLAGCDPTFAVLAGDDAFIAPMMQMGASGAIAAAAHACTAQFAELVALTRPDRPEAGDRVRIERLTRVLLPVVVAGFSEPNPSVWKGWLATDGVIESPALRRPMTVASPNAIARLAAAVEWALNRVDSDRVDADRALCSPGEVGPLSPL